MFKKLFFFLLNFVSKFHMKRVLSFFDDKKFINVIDCGCYKGEFIDIMMKKHSNSKYYCFEPLKENFSFLKKKYKSKKNIKLYNKGIGENKMYFNLKVNISSNASTFSDFNEKSIFYRLRRFILGTSSVTIRKELCEIINIDNFVKNEGIKHIDLLKLDIEGFELKALKGAKNMLRKTNYILIEITNSNLFKDYSKYKVISFLRKNGFVEIKSFLFPIFNFEDKIYQNSKLLI